MNTTMAAPPPNFWGDMPENEYYKSQGVTNFKSYFKTPHGTIFTQSFLPIPHDNNNNVVTLNTSSTYSTGPCIAPSHVKASVYMTHGYGSDTSWLFQQTCITFATWGYAVFTADLLGHGRSDGIPGYIGDMDKAAAASLSFFLNTRRSDQYRHLPAFLFGESMGGAVTMLMYFQSPPDTWTGLIFSAPLFACTQDTKPSRVRLFMYGLLLGLADTWAAWPEEKKLGNAIKDFEKLKLMLQNPRRYSGRARVGTKREVARMEDYLQNNFHKVKAPFLAVHGADDGVTSPAGSEMLYNKASSVDKTLKLYQGMYHSLIQGESDENVKLVLSDMRAWIDERVIKYGPTCEVQ
ncbi:hypothetical protein DCAR_0729277 [Daucus carota subsp. sativus]|uniref:Uncharacterized protein n=1 Tax=Daucus carota subsp. sativus TaxID=79200 RepID=A0A164U3J5_DAUCS|nr:PREDICTED: caffeoylshikimate esterase-like [Daucus carota subsp. sativus]WOH09818.1 hypothetical protein DCAR_0729277 [Daucus carota subsp. sativus]